MFIKIASMIEKAKYGVINIISINNYNLKTIMKPWAAIRICYNILIGFFGHSPPASARPPIGYNIVKSLRHFLVNSKIRLKDRDSCRSNPNWVSCAS